MTPVTVKTVQRMIEISNEKIRLDLELRTLLKAHEREMDAISARRGLSLLVGSGPGGKGSVNAFEDQEHSLNIVVGG